MKKFFIIFNLILAGLFAAGIIILHIEMKNGKIAKYNLEKYDFKPIAMPSAHISGKWDLLFGIKPVKRPDTKSPDRSGKNNPDCLNQLNFKNEVIRVMGIFITKNHKSAAIEIIPKNKVKTNAKGLQRILAGDMVKDYKVMSIMPDYIVLSHPSSTNIIVKIFAE